VSSKLILLEGLETWVVPATAVSHVPADSSENVDTKAILE